MIVEAVADASGTAPEEKVRYGMAAVLLGGRYALHFAGWKKHIGLYPVPVLPEPLETEIAPHRAKKDSVVLPHAKDVPYDLIARVAREDRRPARPSVGERLTEAPSVALWTDARYVLSTDSRRRLADAARGPSRSAVVARCRRTA